MRNVIVNEERCKGCGLCVSACVKGLLSISRDKMNGKGYRPAEMTENEKCVGCAFCAAVCPDAAICIEEA